MRHLPTLLLSTLVAGVPAASAADVAATKTTLTTVRTELDAGLPVFGTSIGALDANRVSALGASWALPGLTQIQDGSTNTLQAAPESPAKRDALAKQAELKSAISAFAAASRDAAARWSAAHSSFLSLSGAVKQLQAKLGELTPKLGTNAAVAGEIETVTRELQRKQEALDAIAATALSTHQAQSAAWQAVQARAQELARLFDQNGNFGSTAGLSGGDMVRKMAEMNMAFLQLQEAVQNESRRYQTLSNASRAKHDLAISAVRNLGGA